MVPMLTCGLVRSNFALAMGPVLLCGGLRVVLDGGAGGRAGCCGGYSPRTFAMISLATFPGTSAYESNCML